MNTMSLKRTALLSLSAAVVALVLALCGSIQAFAVTNVEVDYTVRGVSKSATVDLDLIDEDIPHVYNQSYLFQQRDINNVVKAGKGVSLYEVIKAAMTANGDSRMIDSVWAPGSKLAVYTDEGAYTKFNDFTYENLMVPNYFYGATLRTGLPLVSEGYPATEVATILATSSASMQIPDGVNAQQASDSLTPVTTERPRLLWGWSSTNPGSSLMGGNRFPNGVTKIVIS